jgi:hypothetical protein
MYANIQTNFMQLLSSFPFFFGQGYNLMQNKLKF